MAGGNYVGRVCTAGHGVRWGDSMGVAVFFYVDAACARTDCLLRDLWCEQEGVNGWVTGDEYVCRV